MRLGGTGDQTCLRIEKALFCQPVLFSDFFLPGCRHPVFLLRCTQILLICFKLVDFIQKFFMERLSAKAGNWCDRLAEQKQAVIELAGGIFWEDGKQDVVRGYCGTDGEINLTKL